MKNFPRRWRRQKPIELRVASHRRHDVVPRLSREPEEASFVFQAPDADLPIFRAYDYELVVAVKIAPNEELFVHVAVVSVQNLPVLLVEQKQRRRETRYESAVFVVRDFYRGHWHCICWKK